VEYYDNIRLATINGGFIVAGCCAIFGMLGALFNQSFFCKIMLVSGVISLLFLWLSFAIHIPVAVMVADFCDGIDQILDQQGNSSSNSNSTADAIENIPGLSLFIKCLTNDSYSASVTLLDNSMNTALATLNQITWNYYKEIYTIHTYNTFPAAQFQGLPSNAQVAWTTNKMLLDGLVTIQPELDDLVNCSFARDGFNQTRSNLCLSVLQALDLITGAQGLMGCILLVGLICGVLGLKRFPHPMSKRDQKMMEMQRMASKDPNYDPSQHDYSSQAGAGGGGGYAGGGGGYAGGGGGYAPPAPQQNGPRY